MSNQADVRSIDALKQFRVALALFADDALSALGAADMEARRTLMWLQHDRRYHWQEQIKRRREQVASARAEVFRRKLGQRPDYSPAISEQKEILRRAEADLVDSERRSAASKKWEPALQQAILEYQGSTRRIRDMAGGDIPRALVLLDRIIEALEAYLRVALPTGMTPLPPVGEIAESFFADEPPPPPAEAEAIPPDTSEGPATPDDPA